MTDRAGGADARCVTPPALAKPLGPRRFLRVRKADRRPTDSRDPRDGSAVNGADFLGQLPLEATHGYRDCSRPR